MGQIERIFQDIGGRLGLDRGSRRERERLEEWSSAVAHGASVAGIGQAWKLVGEEYYGRTVRVRFCDLEQAEISEDGASVNLPERSVVARIANGRLKIEEEGVRPFSFNAGEDVGIVYPKSEK